MTIIQKVQSLQMQVTELTCLLKNTVIGSNGQNGKSAYQIALDNNFDGTEEEWLESIIGENGKSAYQLAVDLGEPNTTTLAEWLASLQGTDGIDGTNAQPFNFKGNVVDYAALPVSGNTINDGYYNEVDTLIYIYNGTGFPADGKGINIKVKRENFAISRFNLFNIYNLGSIWKLDLANGALVFGNELQSISSAPSNLTFSNSAFTFVYGNILTGEIITSASGLNDANMIMIGICYPSVNLFSFICDFSVNGNPYNIYFEKGVAVSTKHEWFNIVEEGLEWRLKIPFGSLFYSNIAFDNTNGQVEDILLNTDAVSYIYINAETRRVFKSDVLIEVSNRLFVGSCFPKYGLFGFKIPYSLNGKPYNLDFNDIETVETDDSYRIKLSDVNHVINYGQSLSVGQTETVITTTALYPNLVNFDGVTRTSAYDKSLTGDNYPINRHLAFVPIIERVNDGVIATGQLRETPSSGTLENLALELNKVSSVQFPTLPIQFLASAPGWGATTIAELSKGSQYYAQLIADVTAGKAIANAQGKIYKVSVVTWTQGESDYIITTPLTTREQYKARAIQLKNDLNADIKAITGQTDDIPIVIYQTATSKGGNVDFPKIALAQYDLVLSEAGFYFSTAMYQMDYNDVFHLKAESSKLLGAYYGLTISNILQDKYKFLHPISKLVQGSICKLFFDVPYAPLKFQPANGITLTNKGFKVLKAGVDILVSITLGADGVSVNLICSESPNGALVQYGVNTTTVTNAILNLGNLSDSQGDYKTFTILGNIKKLDNWSPIFEYQL